MAEGVNSPPTGRLSQQAHEATVVRDTEQVQEIEAEIEQVAELWGL